MARRPLLLWPLAWLAYTLIRGPIVNWYPYPFIDVDQHGYGAVALNCAVIAALVAGLGFGALALDRALGRSREAALGP